MAQQWSFDYTGGSQSFTVPCYGIYKLECWGAQGGSDPKRNIAGGKGTYVKGYYELNAGDVLTIFVGGRGNEGNNTAGGYNGGGHAGSGAPGLGSGGGATDMRRNGTAYSDRIIVAGGGGGAGFNRAGSAIPQSNGQLWRGSSGAISNGGGGGGGGYHGGRGKENGAGAMGYAGTSYVNGVEYSSEVNTDTRVVNFGVRDGHGYAVITLASLEPPGPTTIENFPENTWVKGGNDLTVSWSLAERATEYELHLYDGSVWRNLGEFVNISATVTIPADICTDQASFRVRAKNCLITSDWSYQTVKFSIAQVPPVPSLSILQPADRTWFRAGEIVNIAWPRYTDPAGLAIIYEVDLYDGVGWAHQGETDAPFFQLTIPSVNLQGARIRVRARNEYGIPSDDYGFINDLTITEPVLIKDGNKIKAWTYDRPAHATVVEMTYFNGTNEFKFDIGELIHVSRVALTALNTGNYNYGIKQWELLAADYDFPANYILLSNGEHWNYPFRKEYQLSIPSELNKFRYFILRVVTSWGPEVGVAKLELMDDLPVNNGWATLGSVLSEEMFIHYGMNRFIDLTADMINGLETNNLELLLLSTAESFSTNMIAVPDDHLIVVRDPITIAAHEGIYSIDLDAVFSGNGNIRIVVSLDGVSWKTWNNRWLDIELTPAIVKVGGLTRDALNSLTAGDWLDLIPITDESRSLYIAYLIDEQTSSDTAIFNHLTVLFYKGTYITTANSIDTVGHETIDKIVTTCVSPAVCSELDHANITVEASSSIMDYNVEYVLDDDSSTYWRSDNGQVQSLVFSLPTPQLVGGYSFKGAPLNANIDRYGGCPFSWMVEVFDGKTWHLADVRYKVNSDRFMDNYFTLSTIRPCSKLRITMYERLSNSGYMLSKFRLYKPTKLSGTAYLVSFDGQRTWWSRATGKWQQVALKDINGKGMSPRELETITADDWREVFIPGTLDLAIGFYSSDVELVPTVSNILINLAKEDRGMSSWELKSILPDDWQEVFTPGHLEVAVGIRTDNPAETPVLNEIQVKQIWPERYGTILTSQSAGSYREMIEFVEDELPVHTIVGYGSALDNITPVGKRFGVLLNRVLYGTHKKAESNTIIEFMEVEPWIEVTDYRQIRRDVLRFVTINEGEEFTTFMTNDFTRIDTRKVITVKDIQPSICYYNAKVIVSFDGRNTWYAYDHDSHTWVLRTVDNAYTDGMTFWQLKSIPERAWQEKISTGLDMCMVIANKDAGWMTTPDVNIITFNATNTGSTGAIQTWTVPYNGLYRITAYGAEGGASIYNGPGGKGAKMQGDFNLITGTKLKILVGQMGGTDIAGGGGGGTFVVLEDNTPLIIAGGGAGRSYYNSPTTNLDATVETSGRNSTDNSNLGGTDGYGGQSNNQFSGGGGGGLYGDGQPIPSLNTYRGEGGRSFVNGGQGGRNYYARTGGVGGFGGGGHSGDNGGGGGGYSGGAGGYHGKQGAGGGGSYNIGINQDNAGGVNTGHGSVTIGALNIYNAVIYLDVMTVVTEFNGRPVGHLLYGEFQNMEVPPEIVVDSYEIEPLDIDYLIEELPGFILPSLITGKHGHYDTFEDFEIIDVYGMPTLPNDMVKEIGLYNDRNHIEDTKCIIITNDFNRIDTREAVTIQDIFAYYNEPRGTGVRFLLSFDSRRTWWVYDHNIHTWVEKTTDNVHDEGMTFWELKSIPERMWSEKLGDWMDLCIGLEVLS